MKVSFIDEAEIEVESGSGGEGAIHFRRARFLPKGGPDGGDGGRGGDVILTARENLSDLSGFLHKTRFKAPSGAPGGANRQHGKDGKTLILAVPVGTQVFERDTEEQLCDLDTPGARYVVARGGKGGKGNVHYTSPVRQTPRIAQKGYPGRQVRLRLVYKLLADIGVIGPANAGKSSFLARVTSARPKIAPYPYTTRIPQLGVYFTDLVIPLTFVEIPALEISREKRFLKHVERAKALLFFLDLTRSREWNTLLNDLGPLLQAVRAHGHGLTQKPAFLALNKMDAAVPGDPLPTLVATLQKKTGMQVFPVSARSGRGLENLLKVLVASCKLESL